MKKSSRLTSIVGLLALGFALLPGVGRADSASLYLTPSGLSQTVGSNFTISVGANTGGNAINAVEATVTIPSILTITGASTGGSICSIWVQQPSVSGSSVSFKCGIPGGTTSSGNLISISVRAASVGSGAATISGTRILAGPGQNVTGGASGGSYTVTAAASHTNANANSGSSAATQPTTAAPAIASGSHGDQNRWYTNTSPSFSWSPPSGATGYTYAFDKSPDTVPGTTANIVTSTSIGFPNQADGTWYFHVRANGANGWGATSTFRVQIDTTAPTGLEVITEPKQIADKRPMVSFTATDATSGIDHYDISMDNGPFKTVTSPFTPDSITSGNHTFTVRAYDKAGNKTESTVAITIKAIPAPKIATPTANTTFKLIEKLDIAGTADLTTTIKLYLDGKLIAENIPVSSGGVWSYTYHAVVMPGKHDITARAVKDGIESQPSGKLSITIDPSAVSLFGRMFSIYLVLFVLLVIIGLLLAAIIWLWVVSRRRYKKIIAKLAKRTQATEQSVAGELDTLQHELTHDIHRALEPKSRGVEQSHQLQGQITTDIISTKRAISRELEDQTKDL